MVIILGGGVAGLYAARVLTRHQVDVTIIEAEAVPGGLARGQRRGENFYDLGVHMLHEHDREIFEDIGQIMGDERLEVKLDARIRWAGSFYRYPLKSIDMLRGIPPLKLLRMVFGLCFSQLREKISPTHASNAEEALKQLYGKPLYTFFFKDFTHRYWGIHPRELSATFIRTKMPRLSAVDVLKKGLAKIGFKEPDGRAVQSALSEETLHYSASGAESMPRCLAREVLRGGGKILTNSTVNQVRLESQRVAQVCVSNSETGESQWLDCDYCVSTIPLPQLIDSITPDPSEDVKLAGARLRYKAIAVYGLLVKKPKALDALYVYYRDRVFHRVGEPKNAGLQVNPRDHTVLIVETTCQVGDAKWNGDESILQKIFEDLEAEAICRRDEVVETHILRCSTGYPIFDLGFEEHFRKVTDFLSGIPNLQSTGRQGGFCYPNMHSAMRMGADAADNVLKQLGQVQAHSE